MSSEVHGIREWLSQLYPGLRQRSAFLKSGYALRTGVGVGLFAVCHAIFQHESDRRGGNSTLLQWGQGCLWGAITVLTVNFPIMGRIAKQSFERGLGTVVGGWLGYAAYIVSQHPSVEAWQECWTAVISSLFAFAAVLIGVKLKLDYSAKLLGISFVLVLWTPQSEEQALDVAASRISCIVIAIFVMALLAVLIYPQIASELVMGELHSAMQSIADFNRIVWDEVNLTCKEESDRISRSFHLRNNAQDGATNMQIGSLKRPPDTCSGACMGQSMHASQQDSRAAIRHSTAGIQGSVRSYTGDQRSHASSQAGTAPAGTAHLAHDESRVRQGICFSAEAVMQTKNRSHYNGDSGRGSAASYSALERDAAHCSSGTHSHFRQTSLPQGDAFVLRSQEQRDRQMHDQEVEAAIHAHLGDTEQGTDSEAALAQTFRGYYHLDKERPFFDALGEFRSHIAMCEAHVTTALSEVYVGKWAGRRWFFPTVYLQNSLRHKRPGWHIPEQVLKGVRMCMQRTVRVLYMIHCTFRDGFQGEVLEELQHHSPLNLLMTLSDAAVDAMQEFVDSFPRAHVSPQRLMPADALIRLNEVTNELLELAKASRANKVDLIMMGERYRKMLEHGIDPAEMERSAIGFTDDKLPGMRVIAEKLRVAHSSSGCEEGLFLFPNNDAGWLATTRWYSFHFLVQQLVGALVRLRISLNLALPLLPGAEIDVELCSSNGTHPKEHGDRCRNGHADNTGGNEKNAPSTVLIAVE